ncbi:MAG: hypothetical protein JSU70_13875 [Phycisphaerales bacterium]|nr:MAG: hypothetical protein JSU70_13875 [Phycisphaerales bacterium]
MGCRAREESPPIWEQVKLGDIAPVQGDQQSGIAALKTISFDIHAFEIPEENLEELDNVWRTLAPEPLRYNNYRAFRANSFAVRFGQVQMWGQIRDALLAAGGHKVMTASLLLTGEQANDFAVTGLSSRRGIYYVAGDDMRHKVNIGPGAIALRLRAEEVPGLRGLCELVVYPVFTLGGTSPIPQLQARAKSREFQFASAAFGLKMARGDLVVLGPKKYANDESTLGGLVFFKPEGSLFFSEAERKPPKLKPALRVFVLVCTRITD